MAQIDTLCYRKHTQIWLMHRLQNASAAILQRPRWACELLSVAQNLGGNTQGRAKEPCDSSVTTSSHCDTQTHTHTHFLYFLSSALMPPPHQTWSQSGSRVLGRRTKTLPVSCMWMDLIRWWFNLGVCGASESAASWLWALMSSAKNYLRRKISVHESGWGKKKKKWRLAPTCPAWLL